MDEAKRIDIRCPPEDRTESCSPGLGVMVRFDGVREPQMTNIFNACNATLIGRDLVLTSAHCLGAGQCAETIGFKFINPSGTTSVATCSRVEATFQSAQIYPDINQRGLATDVAIVRISAEASLYTDRDGLVSVPFHPMVQNLIPEDTQVVTRGFFISKASEEAPFVASKLNRLCAVTHTSLLATRPSSALGGTFNAGGTGINCEFQEGSSGSAAFNIQGQILGVLSAFYASDSRAAEEDLTRFAPFDFHASRNPQRNYRRFAIFSSIACLNLPLIGWTAVNDPSSAADCGEMGVRARPDVVSQNLVRAAETLGQAIAEDFRLKAITMSRISPSVLFAGRDASEEVLLRNFPRASEAGTLDPIEKYINQGLREAGNSQLYPNALEPYPVCRTNNLIPLSAIEASSSVLAWTPILNEKGELIRFSPRTTGQTLNYSFLFRNRQNDTNNGAFEALTVVSGLSLNPISLERCR